MYGWKVRKVNVHVIYQDMNVTHSLLYSVNLHYLTNITRPAIRFTDPDYTISSFFVKISVSYDDRFLIAGSSSNAVFAWEVDRPGAPTVKYTGHKREVGSVSWCQQQYQV